ncbi:MAG: hypothetical protein VKI83_06815 [Synechococcaceae cyanobacterium]|nr:hypothetical protein [Synechococcaceae cyanobacterium]
MRTTITSNDALSAQAKVLAAQCGSTVGEILEAALQAWLQSREALAAAPLPDLPVHGGGLLRPGVDLDDLSELRSLLGEGMPLDAVR